MSTRTLPTRALRASAELDYFDTADVVIVGLGAAGASAAIEAAAAGCDVLVLEAASAGGGTTALAGGLIYMGGGTPTQLACGIEDSVEDMYRYLLLASGPNADPERVRIYAEGSLEHHDWLLAQGMEFKPEYYPSKNTNTPGDEGLIYSGNEACHGFSEQARPAPRGHKGKAQGEGGGRMLMDKLIASALASGVRVRCDTRALNAILDDDGAVVGVVARCDGVERRIRARRGVILCAGGFIMNTDMVARHAPQFLHHTIANGNPNDNGSGIRIGLGAGGAVMNMHEGFVCLPFYPPAGFVEGIIVNGKGQRIINEDSYHGRVGEAILRNPQEKHYLVLDSRQFGDLEHPPLGGFRVVATGETVGELEAELKLPPGTLCFTLELYNRHAREGQDPLFHKHADYLRALDQGPWAACDISLDSGAYFPVFTFGGLRVRPGGEVLSEDGEVVAGLYSAGRNCCGLPRCGATYSSGMSIGDASFFGRHAGRNAASSPLRSMQNRD
ncbi:MAG: FAD-dependent oxidoreductase [Pseudomonadales bacterium]|nr:FAD-dependent oxidoreductase [Pseudomonadales bacterium]